jgi:hypothetical protein
LCALAADTTTLSVQDYSGQSFEATAIRFSAGLVKPVSAVSQSLEFFIVPARPVMMGHHTL